MKEDIAQWSEARRLLSPDQAALYLGLGSRWAIYRLIAAGALPAVKLAGKVRLDRVDLDKLIQTGKCSVPVVLPRASQLTDSPRTRLGPLPSRRRSVTLR